MARATARRMPLLAEDVDDVGEIGLRGRARPRRPRSARRGPSACRAGRRAGTRSRARPGRAASTRRRHPSPRRRPASTPCAAQTSARLENRSSTSVSRPPDCSTRSKPPAIAVRSRSMPITRVPAAARIGARIAAGAEGGVDIDAAGARCEPVDGFTAEHGIWRAGPARSSARAPTARRCRAAPRPHQRPDPDPPDATCAASFACHIHALRRCRQARGATAGDLRRQPPSTCRAGRQSRALRMGLEGLPWVSSVRGSLGRAQRTGCSPLSNVV